MRASTDWRAAARRASARSEMARAFPRACAMAAVALPLADSIEACASRSAARTRAMHASIAWGEGFSREFMVRVSGGFPSTLTPRFQGLLTAVNAPADCGVGHRVRHGVRHRESANLPTMSAASPATSLRHDATVISLVGFAHGTSHFFHFMIPPLFPWLMAEFGLTFTQVGLTMTVFFVVSSIGQALAGFVVDRFGALRVLIGGITLLSASGLVLASAQNFAMLLAAAMVAGLGNSVFHPADFTLLNRRVSTSRLGHAFSVHGLSGSLGWAAAPFLMVAVAGTWGWRASGVTAAVVGVLRARLPLRQPVAAARCAARGGGVEAGLGRDLRVSSACPWCGCASCSSSSP